VKWKLREAEFLLARREYEPAIALLTHLRSQAAPASELDRVAAQNLAFAQFQCGEFADCVELLRPLTAAASSRPSGSLQQLWLRALHRTGQFELAVQWAKEAEQQGSLDPGAAGVASLIAFDLDDYALAARWVEAARAGLPAPSLEAVVTLAGLALVRQHPQEAISAAGEALKLNPQEGRAWSIRAFAQLIAGEAREAEGSFAQAVRYMPGHVESWQGQGWCQLLLGHLPEAQANFESAVRLDPDGAESHSGLAMSLVLQQKEGAARSALAKALELDPADPAANCVKAILNGEVAGANAARQLVAGLFRSRP
jgi:tetratricopeptide (TPR) repeat protein